MVVVYAKDRAQKGRLAVDAPFLVLSLRNDMPTNNASIQDSL